MSNSYHGEDFNDGKNTYKYPKVPNKSCLETKKYQFFMFYPFKLKYDKDNTCKEIYLYHTMKIL